MLPTSRGAERGIKGNPGRGGTTPIGRLALICAAIGTWCALTTLWYYFVGAAPKVEYSCVGELRRDKVILPSLVSTGAAAFVPKYGRPLNKLANEEDFYGKEWFEPLFEMKMATAASCPGVAEGNYVAGAGNYCRGAAHRKWWEFAQSLYALRMMGLLSPDKVALGVGSGHEQAIFYLTSHMKHVTATDVYDHGGWGNREGAKAFMDEPWAYANSEYPRDKLDVMYMDGTALDFPDASYDVVFCFSSIEHFYTVMGGFHAAATRSILEMARVTKVGGAVVIATEVILNGQQHWDKVGNVLYMRDYFHPHEIESVLVKPAAEAGLELVEPIDWTISDATLSHTITFADEACHDRRPHLVLRNDMDVFWTSISLAFTKVR